MPLYGDIAAVKTMLRPTDGAELGADADARLAALQRLISDLLTHKLGRTFGNGPIDAGARLHWAGQSAVLTLTTPARSISSVVVGVVVSGSSWSGGATYATDLWTPHAVSPISGLIHALRLLSGGWWGRDDPHGRPATGVVVTADWADQDGDNVVPDDVTETANFLIARLFQMEEANPAGFIGPDGQIAPLRDPWAEERVAALIDRYRLRAVPVF